MTYVKTVTIVMVLAFCISISSNEIRADNREEAVVESFKQLVDKVIKLNNNYTNVRQGRTGNWFKERYRLEDIGFDVQRTDSLVSPYVGIVTGFSEKEMSEFFETKEEAEKAPLNPKERKDFVKIKVKYAYQSGKWVLKGGYYWSEINERWKQLWQSNAEAVKLGFRTGTKDTSFGMQYDLWEQQ